MPPSVLAQLALDGLALRVVAAFEARGVPVLLMKGPVTRAWLYADSGSHPYTDVDLLIAPEDEGSAEAVLRELGFRDLHAAGLGLYRPPCERAWEAPEGVVDLHIGLTGVPSARWSQAWREFQAEAEEFVLHGRSLRVMSERARVLHLALHAAQRASGAKARRDLDASIALSSGAVWHAAALLAEDLHAGPAFTSGLVRARRGPALLAELPIRTSSSVLALLQVSGASSEALALAAALDHGTSWRELLGVGDPAVPKRRVRRLRLAAAARAPRAALELAVAAVVVAARRSRSRR